MRETLKSDGRLAYLPQQKSRSECLRAGSSGNLKLETTAYSFSKNSHAEHEM
jgi:hypothetical protein